MPERTNIKVKGKQQSALNRLVEESKGTAKASRKRTSNLTINLERVIKAINEQSYDEDTKKDLIKMAKRCPQGGLLSFMSSLSIHVTAIQRAKRGTNLVEKPVVVSQRRRQGLQDLERKVEKSKVAEALFYDNEEQVKATEIQRLQSQQSPQLPSVKQPLIQPQPQPVIQQQRSREEVVAGMDSRREFAKRLQELQDSDEPEEWLK